MRTSRERRFRRRLMEEQGIEGGIALADKNSADQPGTYISVATTSTPVVAVNNYRTEINIVNDSDTEIYLRFAPSGAALNSGLRLNANGGSYSSERYKGAISAIHGSSGAKKLTVVEV